MASKYLVWGLFLLLLLAYLSTGVTRVQPGEVAVVRRFGRVLDVRPKPGLWIGLPWGMDRVDRVDVKQVRQVLVGYRPDDETSTDFTPSGQLLTGDHNLVNVQVKISYTINPDAVVDYVVQKDRVEEMIVRAAETWLSEWIGARKVDEVLLTGKTKLPFDLVKGLQGRLDEYRLGVRLRSVDVPELLPPDDVKYAFDRVGQAKAESETMITQAEKDAENERSRANSDISRMNKETLTYQFNKERQARAEARAFEEQLRQYQRNPASLEARRWEYLQKMMERLKQNGQLQPLDPEIQPDLPWFEKK